MLWKRRRSRGGRRCWRSRRFVHLTAGCHHTTVTHAHSGGTHGISLRLITKHAWRCPRHLCRRIPERFVLHPSACGCDTLPDVEPESLAAAPPPSPPPAPPPPSVPATCPPAALATMGWELCTWQLAKPLRVGKDVVELSTVPEMRVRCSPQSRHPLSTDHAAHRLVTGIHGTWKLQTNHVNLFLYGGVVPCVVPPQATYSSAPSPQGRFRLPPPQCCGLVATQVTFNRSACHGMQSRCRQAPRASTVHIARPPM